MGNAPIPHSGMQSPTESESTWKPFTQQGGTRAKAIRVWEQLQERHGEINVLCSLFFIIFRKHYYKILTVVALWVSNKEKIRILLADDQGKQVPIVESQPFRTIDIRHENVKPS